MRHSQTDNLNAGERSGISHCKQSMERDYRKLTADYLPIGGGGGTKEKNRALWSGTNKILYPSPCPLPDDK